MQKLNICIITNKYPSIVEPNILIFLEQLVDEMARQGHNCTVICPIPTNIYPKYRILPYKEIKTVDKNLITIFRPRYFGLGQSSILRFNPAKLTTFYFSKAVIRVIKANSLSIDCLYGHFITPAGIATAIIGEKLSKPAYVAYGEATLDTINHYGFHAVTKKLSSLSGLIAVSTKNKRMIENVVPKGIVTVIPNAIDSMVFYPRNKRTSREKFGIEQSGFVVAFVGVFDSNKGVKRLESAVNSLENVKFICAGRGKEYPCSPKCLWSGEVLHQELPYFLSAADVFVLPTLNEGCCNAIIEAMACGLPIISSNLSFNDDILDSTNSIRIDTRNEIEIAQAIQKLQNNIQLRMELAEGSLKKVKLFSLENRTKKICCFLEERNIIYKNRIIQNEIKKD